MVINRVPLRINKDLDQLANDGIFDPLHVFFVFFFAFFGNTSPSIR